MPAGRTLLPHQRSVVWLHDVIDGTRTVVVESDEFVLESPNFTPDGRHLVLNAAGRLRVLPLDAGNKPAGPLRTVGSEPLDNLNNDHLVAPDGTRHLVTDDGQVHTLPWAGGRPRRVTPDTRGEPVRYYLHGQSEDGTTLALTVLTRQPGAEGAIRTNIGLLRGGEVSMLTDTLACDGPEIGPGGPGEPHDSWVWFSSELAADVPGHTQIHRIRLDGSGLEQVTHDERVNWFPHPSPDGRWLVYLAYEPGVQQHPPNVPAQIRLLDLADLAAPPRVLADVFGGQGATNVNGWAPDSRHVAYVDHPVGR